jgi:hypothetical protein
VSAAAAVALVNLVLGLAYTGYGVMTALEMKRDWRVFGFSHFGTAWLFMAFTCGPHHLLHASHALSGSHDAGWLDFFTVAVGLPVGVLWLLLRVEAFGGGRGDRFVPGTPAWVTPTAALAVAWGFGSLLAGAFVATGGSGADHSHGDGPPWMVLANLTLVGLYLAIGKVVLQTQLTNRPGLGGWSVSGLCLAFIFPSCAVMHAMWAAYGLSGQYVYEPALLVVDLLSIPAAIYFLVVVMMLHREALHDWNEGPRTVEPGVVSVR